MATKSKRAKGKRQARLTKPGHPMPALEVSPGPRFDIDPADSALVDRIIERIERERPIQSPPLSGDERLDIRMSLVACHANGMPMRFDKLVAADRFNFYHDVNGILRHIDRTTGTLGGCFVPRFAAFQHQDR